MPPLHSHLQLLPYDIIDRVVDYLPPISNTKKESGGNHTFEITTPSVDPPVKQSDLIVRTLTFHVKCWDPFLNGELVKWMQTSPDFARRDFSSVTTLMIETDLPTGPYSDINPCALNEVKNIAAFFKRIKAVTPNVNNINMLLSSCEQWFLADENTKLIERSIAELVYGRNITFRSANSACCFIYFSPTAISGLTSLCHSEIGSHTYSEIRIWLFEVYRHNASTLKILAGIRIGLEHLEQFLFKDGLPIVYSSLVNMDIKIWYPSFMSINAIDLIISRYPEIRVNHFPALKYLKFCGAYMVAIGHLFESENRSLEYLDVNVYHAFPDMNTSGRPVPMNMLTRFYGLKTVKFAVSEDYIFHFRRQPRYMTFCSDILKSFSGSSSAFYYITVGFVDGDAILRFLNENNLWTTLRGLYVQSINFPFIDLLHLLQKTPLLQSLNCGLDEGPPMIGNINLTRHPQCLKELHYPLSSTLSELVIGFDPPPDRAEVKNIAWSAVMLATLCPKIGKVKITERGRNRYDYCDIRVNVDDRHILDHDVNRMTSSIKWVYGYP